MSIFNQFIFSLILSVAVRVSSKDSFFRLTINRGKYIDGTFKNGIINSSAQLDILSVLKLV